MENLNDENVVNEIEKDIKACKSGDKEYMRNYMRDYIKNSQEVTCPCGGKFKSYNKCLHKKTKKHLKYEEMLKNGGKEDVNKLKERLELLEKLLLTR
jgi:hypothetical protein